MIRISDLKRETGFLIRQRQLMFALLALFALSVFSVWTGHSEMRAQIDTVDRLETKDEYDRQNVLSGQSDFGSAAYYAFHLTYSSPGPLAFAAIGQRDVFPWKHRIRMLALEGQIYETDADNPELSFVGRFDFAFLCSVLLPLFIILVLHDMRSGEREAGRYDLLVVTARKQQALWLTRAIVICFFLSLAVTIPFVVGAVANSAELSSSLTVLLTVFAHILLWSTIVLSLSATKRLAHLNSARLASLLLGIWVFFTIIIPVTSNTLIQQLVHGPSGGDIVLTQREAVNDAWDLPFDATWSAFLRTHPEWASNTQMDSLFEWKWYYAFQQVGDEKAAELSQAYRAATLKKDQYAGYAAIFSPPLLTQRLLSSIAETDTHALIDYEIRVREFHASLRAFYYPLLFNETTFSSELFEDLPVFDEKNASTLQSHSKEHVNEQ